MIDPVSGFVIVWTFLGSALVYVFRAMRIPKHVLWAFVVALFPAIMAAAALRQ